MNYDENSKRPNFFVFLVATVLAIVSIDIFAFTHSWRVLELSKHQELIGVTWALIFLPSVLVQPFATKVFNRFGYVKVWLWSEIVRAVLFLAAGVLLTIFPSIELLLALCLLFGFSYVPFYPTVYVLLKEKFSGQEGDSEAHSTRKMLRASSIFEVSIQVAGVLSIVCASLAYESYGFENLLLIASVSSFLSAISIVKLSKSTGRSALMKVADVEPLEKESSTYSWSYFWKNSRSKFVFGMFHQVPQALIFASNVPLVLLIRDVYRGGPADYGFFDALYSGIGIVVSLFWTKFAIQSRTVYSLIAVCIFTGVSAYFLPLSDSSRSLLIFWFVVFSLGLSSSKVQSRAVLLVSNSTEMLRVLSSFYQMCGNILTLLMLFGMTYLLASYDDGMQNSYIALGLISLLFAAFAMVCRQVDRVEQDLG